MIKLTEEIKEVDISNIDKSEDIVQQYVEKVLKKEFQSWKIFQVYPNHHL